VTDSQGSSERGRPYQSTVNDYCPIFKIRTNGDKQPQHWTGTDQSVRVGRSPSEHTIMHSGRIKIGPCPAFPQVRGHLILRARRDSNP
jgi:hypothetical protein